MLSHAAITKDDRYEIGIDQFEMRINGASFSNTLCSFSSSNAANLGIFGLGLLVPPDKTEAVIFVTLETVGGRLDR